VKKRVEEGVKEESEKESNKRENNKRIEEWEKKK
jgi:hypothetical protein